jgi:hypothetical protein
MGYFYDHGEHRRLGWGGPLEVEMYGNRCCRMGVAGKRHYPRAKREKGQKRKGVSKGVRQ